MQISIFGATTVHGPNGPIADLGGVKPRQILEILAVAEGAPVSKERLADLLWEGRPPRSHLATLESYVCVLRRGLGARHRRDSGIVTVQQGYRLDPTVLQVDLTCFRALLQQARSTSTDPEVRLALLEQALDLALGDLLVDEHSAAWARAERERARREVLGAQGTAAALALALGRTDTAIRHARAALASDPHAEGALRTLMQALRAAGRRPEALHAFFELRDRLGEDLGVDPDRETTALYLELLRDEAPAGDATHAREEVRMLVRLLRQAVMATPGVELPQTDRGWARLAAQLVAV